MKNIDKENLVFSVILRECQLRTREVISNMGVCQHLSPLRPHLCLNEAKIASSLRATGSSMPFSEPIGGPQAALTPWFSREIQLFFVIHVSYNVLTELVLVLCMGSGPQTVWVTGYEGSMGYLRASPAYQVRNKKYIYGIRGSMGFQGYGLRGLRLYCSPGSSCPSLP